MPDFANLASLLGNFPSFSPSNVPSNAWGGTAPPMSFSPNPYAYSGIPPFFQPPPPPDWRDLPEKASPAFVEAVRAYVGPWLRESRAYSIAKRPEWEKWSDVRLGKKSIWDLGERADESEPGLTRRSDGEIDITDSHEGLTDFVYPINGIESSVVTSILNSIFNGSNAIVVEAVESSQDENASTDGFTIAQKLTKFFVRKLDEGKIKKNTLDALTMYVNQGHAFGKAFWSVKHKWVDQVDINSGETRTVPVVTQSCPVVSPIKLDRVLMDWQAVHSNVDLHRGIGHWTERTYDEIIATFETGGYTLNKAEIERRWSQPGSAQPSIDEMNADPDRQAVNETSTVLWVWEWHGEVPYKKRLVESVVTWVTEPDAESPESGVIVRCSKRPALESGVRPIKGAQFIPNIGQQLGVPLIAASKDVHYQLSQALCRFSDGVNHQIQNGILYREGGEVAKYFEKHKSILPGTRIATSDPSGEMAAMPTGNFQPGPQIQLLQELRDAFQRNTVTDTFAGMGGSRKTAAEANLLQQQSSQPASTFATIFVENYLQPLLQIALQLLQANMESDDVITVKDRQGQQVSLPISADEVRNGRFRVVVTLTEQTAMDAAKAQSIVNMLPVLQGMEPLLAREGIQVRYGELIQMWLNLQDVDGTDRVLHQLTQEEQMAQQQAAMQQQLSQPQQGGQQPPGGQGISMAENGGPLGPVPTDQNIMAQMMQQIGDQAGPGAISS